MAGLSLVNPQGFDPERARWMAPGAHDIVNQAAICATVAEAVSDVSLVVGTTGRRRRWSWPVWGPDELALQAASAPSIALVFGPEDTGLSNADMAPCHALLCLPTASHASLNLGQAVTVCCALLLGVQERAGRTLEHAARSRQVEHDDEPVANAAALLGTAEAGLGLLERTSYLAGRSREQVQGTLYRLLGRAAPAEREVHVLRGMIKALDHALKDR